jgi:hypothetical protein
VGEVGPWWELEEFGVISISVVGTERGELVGRVGIGA